MTCESDIMRMSIIIRIKHENELDGKSTAVHAKIIAPDEVEIYPWNKMPKYVDPDDVLLLFVGKVSFDKSFIYHTALSRLYSALLAS